MRNTTSPAFEGIASFLSWRPPGMIEGRMATLALKHVGARFLWGDRFLHDLMESYPGLPCDGFSSYNNKISTMKRQADGFHDTEFFKLKIMASHDLIRFWQEDYSPYT
ncbi:MAG: hypothetical protein ABSD38_29700 [Syntrophorhabdales bacterium]